MARLVNCRLLKKELPGLEFPPFPGPDGQSIYDSISKEAWLKLSINRPLSSLKI